MLKKIKNALISVSDKENLVKVLRSLNKHNVRIISSGGSYKYIRKLGYDCIELSKYTGFKEMLDGRVKTLHPKIMLEFCMTGRTNCIKMKCLNLNFHQ